MIKDLGENIFSFSQLNDSKYQMTAMKKNLSHENIQIGSFFSKIREKKKQNFPTQICTCMTQLMRESSSQLVNLFYCFSMY